MKYEVIWRDMVDDQGLPVHFKVDSDGSVSIVQAGGGVVFTANAEEMVAKGETVDADDVAYLAGASEEKDLIGKIERPFYEKLWKTQRGDAFELQDLSDSHLENIIRLLERYHNYMVAQGHVFLSTLQGEMAIDCAEREVRQLEEYGSHGHFQGDELHASYTDLLDERERRKEKR